MSARLSCLNFHVKTWINPLPKTRPTRNKMDPRRRPARLRDSTADDASHLLRTFKLVQPQQASPQLERRVRVRANRASHVVLLGKESRLAVELRKPATRVVHLDRIHQRKDFQQVILRPTALAEPVKRVRHADKRALIPQPSNRLLRS